MIKKNGWAYVVISVIRVGDRMSDLEIDCCQCEIKEYDSKNITDSKSKYINPSGRNGPLVARVPIVISHTRIHTSLESKVKLDRKALDIRNCRKKLCLTNCKLVDMRNTQSGTLFIDGCIIEDIDYVDAGADSYPEFQGIIRSTRVKFPFKTTARITYYMPPVLRISDSITPAEYNISVMQPAINSGTIESDTADCMKLMYELENVKINELNILKGVELSDDVIIDSQTFDTVSEVMEISMTFIISQIQSVNFQKY